MIEGVAVDYKFQINLRGIIDLLSNHLYSGPEVYLRELLQNGVDAIRARLHLEPDHRGEITLEVLGKRGGKPPTLVFTDNGIGLTEEEIHRFLATIGQSSKNAEFWDRPSDFIGQFGIGLLSCFVVSDEIVVITLLGRGRGADHRMARQARWHLHHQAYSTAISTPGTQVYLTCKKGCEEYFEPERVAELATHYGSLLPYPIRVISGKGVADPQRRRSTVAAALRQRGACAAPLCWNMAARRSSMDFFDAIPLRSAVGEVEGVAFVLPFSPSLATKRTHRVYLKHMLLSENAEDLRARLGVLRQVRRQRQRPAADRLARIVLRGRQTGRHPRGARPLPARLSGRTGQESTRTAATIHRPTLSVDQGAGRARRRVLSAVHRLAAVRDDAGRHDARRISQAQSGAALRARNSISSARSPASPPRRICASSTAATPTTPNCWKSSARFFPTSRSNTSIRPA